MKFWIGRDNPIITEDMEHYIERHPEDEIRYAKIHIFYDEPIWKDGRWCCAREMWEQCIPYEGNEHLLGTTDDCDEFYKTW